jgi:hypothetical protein
VDAGVVRQVPFRRRAGLHAHRCPVTPAPRSRPTPSSP